MRKTKLSISGLLILTLILLTPIDAKASVLLSQPIPPKMEKQVKEVPKKVPPEHKPKTEPKKQKKEKKDHWKSLGSCRVTEYCPWCNDPPGTYQSSSGVSLYEGCVACSWLENGTKIKIDGVVYTVVDTCGTDAIDIFRDTACCQCSKNEHEEVYIYEQ